MLIEWSVAVRQEYKMFRNFFEPKREEENSKLECSYYVTKSFVMYTVLVQFLTGVTLQVLRDLIGY